MSAKSTFHLPSITPSVPVHLPPASDFSAAIARDDLLTFPAFKTWLSTLQRSLSLQYSHPTHEFHKDPYNLRSITIQAVDRFGASHRLGFIKLTAQIVNSSGATLPGSILLRGGSVAMLVILQPDDVPTASETDKHVLLTVQPRVPAASLAFAELPAGMLDNAGSFAGAAAKEIQEELGLELPAEELVDLTALALADTEDGLQKAVYLSPGGSDEFLPCFLHQRRVKREDLDEWTGKLTGLRDEGEKITLKCVRLEHLWREAGRDAKALCAVALYDGLRREGKIPDL